MTHDRRSFLKQSSLALVATGLPSPDRHTPDAPFVHHALLWLRDSENKAVYIKLVAALKQLKQIATIRFLHVGTPTVSDVELEARATDTTYTVSYLAVFDSKADKENYLRHPLHAKFVSEFGPVISAVKIFDSTKISD